MSTKDYHIVLFHIGELTMKTQIVKNIIIYSIAFILLYYVYTLFHLSDVICYIFHLFFPLIIALFIHFLLEPVIDYLSGERLSRHIVVIHLYLSLSVIFMIVCYFFAPYLFEQCLRFYNQLCSNQIQFHPLITSLIDFLNQYDVLDYVLGILNGWTQSVFYWVSNLFLGMGISFYLSYDHLHLIERLIIYLPFEKQGIMMQTLKRLKLVTYQFIKSIILDFCFFFMMCLLIFYFIDEKIYVWIALFLALTNLIPYIGPYIGGIPVVIYEYVTTSQRGYMAFIAVIVIQYLESSYIQPYLFSKNIRIHPIALFIALSLFGDFFGIVGMIFSPLLLSYSLIIIDLFKKLKVIHQLKRIVFKDS